MKKFSEQKKNFMKNDNNDINPLLEKNVSLRKKNIKDTITKKRLNFSNQRMQTSLLEIDLNKLEILEEYKNFEINTLVSSRKYT